MSRWIWMIAGQLLIWLTRLDVFLIVLYARVGTSIVARHVAGWLWRFFRAIASSTPRYRNRLLSFAGPLILLAIIVCWTWVMNLGAAMIVYPNLGGAIRDTSGPTETSFLTALYAGGISLSVVGASNYAPQITSFRMFYLLNSVIGTSVLSLTLTYLMQVYNALQRRAAVALQTHLSTGETGDAADLIAGIGPQGQFNVGIQPSVRAVLRPQHPARVLFALPGAALLPIQRTLLRPAPHGRARNGHGITDQIRPRRREIRVAEGIFATEELWRGSMKVLTSLTDAYLPQKPQDLADQPPNPETRRRWRERYQAAIQRLHQAGITTNPDQESGAEAYISLRARWDGFIQAFIRSWPMTLPKSTHPVASPKRPCAARPLDARLRSVVRQSP